MPDAFPAMLHCSAVSYLLTNFHSAACAGTATDKAAKVSSSAATLRLINDTFRFPFECLDADTDHGGGVAPDRL